MKLLSEAATSAIFNIIRAEMGDVVATVVIVESKTVEAVVKAYNDAPGEMFTVPQIPHQTIYGGWANETADAILSMLFDDSLENETLVQQSGRIMGPN